MRNHGAVSISQHIEGRYCPRDESLIMERPR